MAARRGKSQARRSGGGRGGIPIVIWVLIGILLGLVIAAGVLLKDRFFGGDPIVAPRPNPAARAPATEEPVAQRPPEQQAPRRPRYDFYTVLPEREVVVPDEELSRRARAEAQPPTPSPSSTPDAAPASERYLLQAGSFSDPGRAEEVKASIAFTGLVARVEPATTAEGVTVHRVILGPFNTARDLENAKQQLAASNIPSVAVRVR